MSALWWPLVLSMPLLGGLVQFRWRFITPWLWLCCVPALIVALWLPPELDLEILWPGARWGIDEMGRRFLGFTAAVWLAATLYAGRDQPETPYGRGFWLAWLLTFTGNVLLIISLDGAGFYVGYSVMSLSAYLLIIHLGGPSPRKGGRIYLQLAVISELLIFAGLMLRFEETAFALELSQWRSETTAPLTTLLLLAGFGIKLGVWPLHLWMPFSYPVAPPVVCAVLSGAMMKTALLGLWTFLPWENPLNTWTDWLLIIAAVSAFFGVIAGLVQTDARKVLAYSSISQAGYLLATVVFAWHQPENRHLWGVLLAMFAAHHGLAKAALFLGAGLAATYHFRVVHWLITAIPALALAGLPLTTGAVVKTALEQGIKKTAYESWLPLLVLGSLATGLLVLRALWRMYRSQPDWGCPPPVAGTTGAWLFLSVTALALPWLWPVMNDPLRESLTAGKLLSSTAVVALALVLAALAVKFPLAQPRHPAYRHPGLAVSLALKLVMEKFRLPPLRFPVDRDWWRQRERRWNRFWQHSSVSLTALSLTLLLMVAWLWWL